MSALPASPPPSVVSVVKRVQANSRAENLMRRLLEKADIRIGGDRPWDMQLNVAGVAERLFAHGSLGFGEAYMDGDWDVDQLDEFFCRILRARLDREVHTWSLLPHILRSRFLNLQNMRRAWQVGAVHYDLGNDFYEAMLDPRMTYTCAYWKNASTLGQAQEAKLDLVCRKLGLAPGMRVLDIGCGWGSFMGYAAQHYGVSCVGVTVSREQTEWARRRYADLGLDFHLQDYRDTTGQFDRIVSIGMFEHVGRKNHRAFAEVANRCLTDDGLFLLHTIGNNERSTATNPWIDKYIFPNGDVPSMGQIGDAVQNLFVVEDVHNFGADYDRTLMAWHANFEAGWPRFSERLGERFRRMWRYYLLSCAGAFRARDMQLWQCVLSKYGVPGGYARPPD
jgi:cyclopropane-fatty-acyl-phospholipid synthase